MSPHRAPAGRRPNCAQRTTLRHRFRPHFDLTFAGRNVNQLAFVLSALVGALCASIAALAMLRRSYSPSRLFSSSGKVGSPVAIFAQWPTTALVLDPASENIVAANPAALRSFGYSQEEVCKLPFTTLFSSAGVDPRNLVARLRNATTREPLELRQHCRDGSQRSVEATCYSLTLGDRPVLAVAVHDVTVRRIAETQLMEKHQQLDHLANHDALTGLPNRLHLAAHLPEA